MTSFTFFIINIKDTFRCVDDFYYAPKSWKYQKLEKKFHVKIEKQHYIKVDVGHRSAGMMIDYPRAARISQVGETTHPLTHSRGTYGFT